MRLPVAAGAVAAAYPVWVLLLLGSSSLLPSCSSWSPATTPPPPFTATTAGGTRRATRATTPSGRPRARKTLAASVSRHSSTVRNAAADDGNGGNGNNDGDSDVYYQRAWYRWSLNSDVETPSAVVVEERRRFAADVARPGSVVPCGPPVLVLRDGRNVTDGEIGPAYFAMPDGGGNSGGGSGSDRQASMVCALYLAANPDLCRGQLLDLSTDAGLGSLLGCVGAGCRTLSGSAHDPPAEDRAADDDDDDDDDILTIASGSRRGKNDALLPPDFQTLLISNRDEEWLALAHRHRQAAGLSGYRVEADVWDWRVRGPVRTPRRDRAPAAPPPEYQTIVASSDAVGSYPEIKALARAVAHRLAPSTGPYVSYSSEAPGPPPLPRFVYLCPDGDDRGGDDAVQLRRLLERGYRMAVSTQYLQLEKLTFHAQRLPAGAPETALDDLVLELRDVRESSYRGLVAVHHPDYAGGGSGELFFPYETGEYDAAGGSAFLEKETGSKPW